MWYYKTLLILFLLCLCNSFLSAQEYEVNLRLSTLGNSDQLQSNNLHMHADYDIYGYGTDILIYLIEQHYKGQIALFTDQNLLQKVSPDSISYYLHLPAYALLDSLVDCKEIFYAEDYASMFPEGYNKNWDDSDLGGEYLFDDNIDTGWEINSNPLEVSLPKVSATYEPDSMDGREQIGLFQEYHVYLQETWSYENGSLSMKSNLIRIDLFGSNYLYDYNSPIEPDLEEYDKHDEEFPRRKVLASIFLKQSDWQKIPVELIFEKKWNSLSGASLTGIFAARNFPALIVSIKQKGEKAYLFREKSPGGYGYRERDSLLEAFNYPSFYHAQRDSYWKNKEELIFESVSLSLSNTSSETDSISIFFTEENSGISQDFLSSTVFQELLQKCYSREIPSITVGEYILDPYENEELDSTINSLQITGLLSNKNSAVSFVPQNIIITDRVGHSKGPTYNLLSISISDIQEANIVYKGKDMYDFLSSLTYYFQLGHINKVDIRSHKEEEYLRNHLFMGTWDKIKQKDKDHWTCDWDPKGTFLSNK